MIDGISRRRDVRIAGRTYGVKWSNHSGAICCFRQMPNESIPSRVRGTKKGLVFHRNGDARLVNLQEHRESSTASRLVEETFFAVSHSFRVIAIATLLIITSIAKRPYITFGQAKDLVTGNISYPETRSLSFLCHGKN